MIRTAVCEVPDGICSSVNKECSPGICKCWIAADHDRFILLPIKNSNKINKWASMLLTLKIILNKLQKKKKHLFQPGWNKGNIVKDLPCFGITTILFSTVITAVYLI